MSDPRPLFVAPSPDWTGWQTVEAFAAERGREVRRHGDGTFSLAGDEKHYRMTIMQALGETFACVWVVLEDEANG